MMRNDRKIDVSFPARVEDYIRRFMKVAERTRPNASLVPIFAWHIRGTFTDKVSGEVRALGPGVDVGAIDPKELTDELIAPMGGRITGTFGGQKRAARKTKCKMPALEIFPQGSMRSREYCLSRRLGP